jgi:hypothetical protein
MGGYLQWNKCFARVSFGMYSATSSLSCRTWPTFQASSCKPSEYFRKIYKDWLTYQSIGKVTPEEVRKILIPWSLWHLATLPWESVWWQSSGSGPTCLCTQNWEPSPHFLKQSGHCWKSSLPLSATPEETLWMLELPLALPVAHSQKLHCNAHVSSESPSLLNSTNMTLP